MKRKQKPQIDMKEVEKTLDISKKIMYFLPVAAWLAFYGYLIFGKNRAYALDTLVLIAGASFLISAAAMLKGKVWGFIPGFFIGVALISTAMQETAPEISLWPGGIAICLYYGICSLIHIGNK